jgi:hypothetical protein
VDLHPDFWKWTLPERRAWFNREVMVRYLPKEVLPGGTICKISSRLERINRLLFITCRSSQWFMKSYSNV